MRITYITAKAFGQWVKKVTPEDMLEMLDFDPDDVESVQQWLKENCEDLEYEECKEHFVQEYLKGMRAKSEEDIEYENLMWSERLVADTFGTHKISEAFKKVAEKYRDQLLSVNVDPRSIDELPELSILIDYVTAKYKCVDYSIDTQRDLHRFTDNIEYYDPKTDINRLWSQIETVFNVRPARSIKELVFTFENVAFFIPRTDETIYYLICYYEPVNLEQYRALVLTHSSKHPTIIIIPTKLSPYGRILAGVGALVY